LLSSNVAKFTRHKDAEGVLRWLRSLGGVINLDEYRVIDEDFANFVCFDPGRLASLRAGVRHIRARLEDHAAKGEAYNIIVCGDGGSGKSKFVDEVMTYLNRHDFKRPKSDLNLLRIRDSQHLKSEIEQRLGELAPLSAKDQAVMFVDEANKTLIVDGVATHAYSEMLEHMWPKDARLLTTVSGDLDRARIVWFYAGTFGANAEAAIKNLNSWKSGEEFGRRLDRSWVPELPDSDSPFQIVIKSVALVRTKHRTIQKIDSRLLLSLAVQQFSFRSDVDNRIAAALQKAAGRPELLLEDAWDPQEIAAFCLTYEDDFRGVDRDNLFISIKGFDL
jgi:hypothetical protein